jgi:hypothetical protein
MSDSSIGWYLFHDAGGRLQTPAGQLGYWEGLEDRCRRCGAPRQGLMWGPCPGTPEEQAARKGATQATENALDSDAR